MIQLNLLPDVKLEYIKAQKLRSLVTSVSAIVTGVSVVILVLLLLFSFAQKKDISSLTSTVTNDTSTLQGEPQIDKILTVQNQLRSLTELNANKLAVSRLFTTYLDEITPESVSLNQLSASFTENNMTLTGTTDSLTTVDKYVDTLKFTTYSVDGSKQSTNAFTNVVLSTFGINSQATNPSQAANFTITFDFAQPILLATDKIKLTVPNIITTRSEQEEPGDLFKVAATGSQNNSSAGGQ